MADLASILARSAEEFGHQAAVVSSGDNLSYADYISLIYTRARRLRTLMDDIEGPVCLIGPVSIEYITTLLAVMAIGRVVCPLSERLPAESLRLQADRIGCRLLIHDRSLPTDRLPETLKLFGFDELGDKAGSTDESEGVHALASKHAGTILFTAGSTSAGKAVLHSFNAHYYSALGSNNNISLVPGDRWRLSLPLYHVGGLSILFRCLLGGAAVVIPDKTVSLAESIVQHEITHLSVVPTQLDRLLSETHSSNELSSLKAVLLGGAAASRNLIDRAVDVGLPLYTTYGCTEAASQVTTTAPNATRNTLYSSGRLLEHRRLMLADNGEILIGGDTMCDGYIISGEVKRIVEAAGWYATGDIGMLDDDGQLHVLGRKDEMIISGGENICPQEIEAALTSFDAIQEAVVVGVPSKRFGHRPIAFIKLRSGSDDFDEKILRDQLREALPGFKIPDRIFPWPDEISDSSMKPDRRRIAALAGELVKNN